MKHMLRLCVTTSVLVLSTFALSAQTIDYFTDYPGGFTETHYEITTRSLANPIELSWIIEPTEGDELIVTTTNRVTAHPQDLELGVLNGIAEAQLIIQSESVRALLENPRNLLPNSTFVVPGGGQFRTAARDVILGVNVICGVLTNSGEPDERILLAITEDPTLPFPPFVRKDRIGATGSMSGQLQVCDSLVPLLDSEQNFEAEFLLEITVFEREA